MHIFYAYRLVAVGSKFNEEKITHDKFRWRRGQILTLKNDPICSRVPRVVIKYKLHWDGVRSNFNVEK